MVTTWVADDWDQYAKMAGSLSRLALRHQVNRMLAERGVDVRIMDARSVTERNMLGDYYLVDHLKRHIIIRDHVDLLEFAREIGVSLLQSVAADDRFER